MLKNNILKSTAVISLFFLIIFIFTGCKPAPIEEEVYSQNETIEEVSSEKDSKEEEASDGELQEEVSEKEADITDTRSITYKIVDTNQSSYYNNSEEIGCPQSGEAFYGQDANYDGNQPSYADNGDGTITDLNTGLMWQKDPGQKMTYQEAVSGAGTFNLAGYDDWRLPTIKELYSLILFSGTDPSGSQAGNAVPFIDTDYFIFEYGDESAGERMIDSQFISSTKYVSTTMNDAETAFGVNFADGRIKGYPTGPVRDQPEGKEFFVLYVRGNTEYGINDFTDNADGTITDNATGLMWSKTDSSEGMTWEEALYWVEQKNKENYLGYSDWRLPDAKELQSIVDYSKSPDTTDSAAIDDLFEMSEIINEDGKKDYPFFWTSTTHIKSNEMGDNAAYISFGRAQGYMKEFGGWVDVHGAGAQRSAPKAGNPDNYPQGHGPQGDAIRIYNYIRIVRNIY